MSSLRFGPAFFQTGTIDSLSWILDVRNVPATALLLQCPANPGEVVVAVSDGMIFEKKLTRQRGIRVEGDWSRPIELLITERSNHRRRDLAIPQKQIDRLILRDRRGRLEYVGGVGRVESAKVFVELRQVLTMLHLSDEVASRALLPVRQRFEDAVPVE